MLFSKIKKRDGRIAPFDKERIINALFKAFEASAEKDGEKCEGLANIVVNKLTEKYKEKKKEIPSIEEVQDLVEETLIENGYAKVAKAYILYRQKRAEIRKEKQFILDKEEIDEIDKLFDINALQVLKSRYLKKNAEGKVIESPSRLFERVAIHAALTEILYDDGVFKKTKSRTFSQCEKVRDKNISPTVSKTRICEEEIEKEDDEKLEKFLKMEEKLKIGKFILNRFHIKFFYRAFLRFEKRGLVKITFDDLAQKLQNDEFKKYENVITDFYEMMISRKFMPNTPAVANFGNFLGMGSACFALDIDDSIESIMETLRNAAVIFKSGGGLGYNFSKLRPKGDFIKKTGGTSSGPLSFMQLFDTMTEVVKQGGIRRGANMGILNSNHPDAEEFISAKTGNKALQNFNISVLMMPDFWDYYKQDKPYPLINPRTGEIAKYVSPKLLFDKIVYQAWESAEPGMIFFDHINSHNPFLKSLGPIVTTNPCVVGSTLVAVADGRNYISIKQLAEEGKDVPVYCFGDGKVRIRIGRMPRKTGEKVPVWKVTLDDGGYIIATEDHKFRDRDNKEIKLKDLKTGTSLMPFYKFQYKSTGKKSPYWGICLNNNERSWAEHRLIAEFYSGKKLAKYPFEVVHHKDFNGLNNIIENLEVLSQSEHDSLHQTGENNVMKRKWWDKLSEEEKEEYKKDMSTAVSGDKNGMFGRRHKKETKILISQKAKRRFLNPENRKILSEKIKLIYATSNLAQRISQRMTIYNKIAINCGGCGISFIKKENRPTIFCSRSCATSFINSYRDTSNLKYTLAQKREQKRKKLYELATQFLKKENRMPTYNEFRNFAKLQGINGDARSAYGGYRILKRRLEFFNHKVVSVEFYGYEDVYNITVDNFHTVAYITNPNAKTKFSKQPLISGIITSQCGELPLYPSESCNLGSINLWAFVKKEGRINGKKFFDWQDFERIIRLSARFLDNVIDINSFPLLSIEKMTLNTRKIGLGIMGLGDLFYDLEISYNSAGGLNFMEKIAEFLNYHSKIESIELAKKRGPFPYFEKSFYGEGKLPFSASENKDSWNFDWKKIIGDIKQHGIRNSVTTVIAPTGSISMICGCSSGIEPVYSLVFQKNVAVGSFYYLDPVFEQTMLKEGLFDDILIKHILDNSGSLQNISYIPPKFKKIFAVAHDVAPEDHIKALAAFQKWTDSSISKTINFPANASVEQMKKAYLLAYELKCKDVTVFRDKSIQNQVLVAAGDNKKQEKIKEEKIKEIGIKENPLIRLKDEKAIGMVVYRDSSVIGNSGETKEMENLIGKPKNCPNCGSGLSYKEGCVSCPICGWGLCA